MRTINKGLWVAGVLAALSGCGVSGEWTMQSIDPESARAHFNLQWLQLMEDGRYAACAQATGKTHAMSGRYLYDQKAGTLMFKTTDGTTRTYNAKLVGLGDQLKVSSAEPSQAWTAVMKRLDSCPNGMCRPAGTAGGPGGGDSDSRVSRTWPGK